MTAESVKLVRTNLGAIHRPELYSNQFELLGGLCIDIALDVEKNILYYVLRDQEDNEIEPSKPDQIFILEELQEWFESHVDEYDLEKYYDIEGEEESDVFYYGHRIFAQLEF
ncbi:MAG: hypothetical protein E6Q36_01180 [Chryseobacterium sp.]|nr:MAG: hypothetical protein E6Q36_01180 [Chryseobacterium sp.]